MRRLTVMQLVPALASGGVERTTLEVAAAVVAAGHRSIVVSAGGRLVPDLETAGSEHVTLPIGSKSLRALVSARALRTLLAGLRPDIVHARSRLPAWLGWWALRGLTTPRPHFITSVHGLNSPGWYSSILARGERVICVSPTVREHVLRQWPSTDLARLCIIEPGIDVLHFSAGTIATPDGAAPPGPHIWRLLLPGRGTRLKGHAHAIDLVADLRAAGVAADLHLLGALEPGREAYVAQLRAQAAALGISAQVRISEPSPEIVAAYRDCDLVLQVSDKPEAFGRTVVEALSVGKPVVGWAHGGVGDLLARHFPQGAVPLGDRQALLATTLALLRGHVRPAPYRGQSLAAMQAQSLEVYESVAG